MSLSAITHGGAEQLSYISRSLGLPKPLLEEAFEQCAPKYEPIVVYTDPPPGRNTVMIGGD
jgi:hypothetical protein